jgi:asparagine synthase (glutamine-hydrolysing)
VRGFSLVQRQDCRTLKGRATIVFRIWLQRLPRFARNDEREEAHNDIPHPVIARSIAPKQSPRRAWDRLACNYSVELLINPMLIWVVKNLVNMDLCKQLRSNLEEAVGRNRAEGILLSGGLDTSILAFVARPSVGFTVALKDSPASDLVYSEKIAKLLGIQHKKMEFTREEALAALPEVIRMLRTFDLALPNDLSIYFALKLAKELTADSYQLSVMTGDGADELFAGYSYMTGLLPENLGRYIRRLSQDWHFSAGYLGRALGVEVRQPFLDEDFVRFALKISPELKVHDGVGKYILRKSFENLIPAEIVWRRKEAIEYGSGSTKLHEIINNMVTDEEFKSATSKVDIKFMNKEHFFYWRIYNEVVGEIPKAESSEKRCPCCGTGMGRYHCPTCGFSRPLL